MTQGLFASLYETNQPFALIDTRERRDHVNGHWFGSTNVPLSVLSAQITRLIPDKHFPVYLLDWQDTANRVACEAAAQQLEALGYTAIHRRQTGNPANYGNGFVKGEYVWSKAFGEVVAHTAGLPEVTPAEYLANYKNARLFDVRPTAEYQQFTIPGSQSLPNSLLLANTAALAQSGEMTLLHCAGRTRSIIGACTLKAAGYSGPYAIFKGGTQAWQLDGLEREFNATTLFAKESNDTQTARDFLDKWGINFRQLNNADLEAFVDGCEQHHLFDVSDDAATGQTAAHNMIKISGTNLIQQTDRSIARYHVPVVLFDHGSGSRAAFAAYWLRCMGFDVSVVYLTEPLATKDLQHPRGAQSSIHPAFTTAQLIMHRDAAGLVFDCRSSGDYGRGHLRGAQWHNISEILQRSPGKKESIVVIGRDTAHACETADILVRHGWTVAGTCAWDPSTLDAEHIQQGKIESAVDQCALFAGRHHGNMQDSRDYLAWEEELPGQIDQLIHQQWLALLGVTAA